MKKKINTFILPIEEKVVFPYQSVKVRMKDIQHYDRIQPHIYLLFLAKQYNQLIGLVTLLENSPIEKNSEIKKIEKFSLYGTLVRITREDSTQILFVFYKRFSSMPFLSSSSIYNNFRVYSAFAFARFRVAEIIKHTPYYIASIEIFSDELINQKEQELVKSGLIQQFKKNAKSYFQMISYMDEHRLTSMVENEKSLNKLIFSVASSMEVNNTEKLKILQTDTHEDRIKLLNHILSMKNDELKVTRDVKFKNIIFEIEDKVRNDLVEQSKRIILKKQLDQINKELQGGKAANDEIGNLEERIQQAQLPQTVKETAEQELKRLKSMGPQNQESSVIRNYIELILSLPWEHSVEETRSIMKAKEILDRDHSGLQKVKQRILQFLAVKQLNKLDTKGSIICFHGPPGVGKTSLGQSIAASLGRPFFRLSLGGISDEAQIRGHRRTYVAAMPGQIISAMKKVKCKNPVILLDEIDKLGRDSRGNPSSALLEVLDPEQNSHFVDHYLGLEFDLSSVMFLATANDLNTIQPPLLDRLELINIPGYTFDEKIQIALSHLVPKQLKKNGIQNEFVEIPEETLQSLIQDYTREAGVRQIERNLSAVFRHVALQQVQTEEESKPFQKVKITTQILADILGPPMYKDNHLTISMPGIAKGLAWTQAGGKMLIVEVVKMPGKGQIEVTGKLGDVMKESVKASLGYIKSNWSSISKLTLEDNSPFKSEMFEKIDLHIHFPAGAIPKDGPSAGVTITTAIVSLLLNRKVKNDIAMTGEITLTGQVLPVGGIKEKVLAAFEQNIRKQRMLIKMISVILPFHNERDTYEIEKSIKDQIKFYFVENISEVLYLALNGDDQVISNKSMTKYSKL